ncbi:hypothetical protein [Oceanobacillus sojae]|uniref:hypothetical protein n=1 Tax=Oceanobacillus sojae TaxID=582851 RepID=UPI00158B9693|nr:hypothetical protein [Oceanobacillus sojae]
MPLPIEKSLLQDLKANFKQYLEIGYVHLKSKLTHFLCTKLVGVQGRGLEIMKFTQVID